MKIIYEEQVEHLEEDFLLVNNNLSKIEIKFEILKKLKKEYINLKHSKIDEVYQTAKIEDINLTDKDILDLKTSKKTYHYFIAKIIETNFDILLDTTSYNTLLDIEERKLYEKYENTLLNLKNREKEAKQIIKELEKYKDTTKK